VIEVSAGVVIGKGKILCMQRGESRYNYISHKYEFPGGKKETGEDPKTTLIREFKEELNATITDQNTKYYTTIQHNYPDFSIIMDVFLIFDDEFSFSLSEHINYKWVDPNRLQELDWADADKQIIGRLGEQFA